ncbi:uncharacterized protein [Pyrus communis]|uniref:uncharacterized protein n=1 Tax=Pyrus communis TaxID=23211 RepID=UPI0035C0BF56
MKTITSTVVKKFIVTEILHRYGVPEIIVTNHGPSFISKEVEQFATEFKIKMIQSSPYYPQSNSQAEASNKILVIIIKRMIAESLEKWHKKLGDTLWPYRTSKRFGLHSEEYIQAMCQGIEDLDVVRIEALNKIQEGKKAVPRAYNKKVKLKTFKEGELVWKVILPSGAQVRGFEK